MTEAKKVHNIGELVNEEGWYVCVPCGYRKFHKRGEQFEECISCLKAHKDVEINDIMDEGSWEKIGE